MAIKAAIFRQVRAPLSIESIDMDTPRRREVLVRTVATGVCHSDLHTRQGNFGNEFPYLLGHEATA